MIVRLRIAAAIQDQFVNEANARRRDSAKCLLYAAHGRTDPSHDKGVAIEVGKQDIALLDAQAPAHISWDDDAPTWPYLEFQMLVAQINGGADRSSARPKLGLLFFAKSGGLS
jgi:hypothetical protein